MVSTVARRNLCDTRQMERILGPTTVIAGLSEPGSVQVDDHGDRLVVKALVDLDGLANGTFATTTVGCAFEPTAFAAPNVDLVGFGYTQFALPLRAGPGGGFDFAPAINLDSPPAVLPLLLMSDDGRCELLAPLDAWHEQVISVEQSVVDGAPRIDRFVWGWLGDLDVVPAGFEATLGIFTGTSVHEVFNAWGSSIRGAAGTTRPGRYVDPLLTHLSYWTDNGAAYWYRTEAGKDITTTLSDKLAELDALGVGIGSVELDSWFYTHEVSRPVSETGYLEAVPPTGMLSWKPRAEVLPDGMAALRKALGNRPLALHSRHISPTSPYLSSGSWWVGERAAMPSDFAVLDEWCRDAASWGATCIEQDWMMVAYFGNEELRAQPGRSLAWQRALDQSATNRGLHLLWCMALPGDFAATVELDRVMAIRTSDDYRFAEDPALLWIWYLTVNVMADSLGLPVFKDCFFSATPDGGTGDATDGDQHAELEALLAVMSAGVVGIGDRIGRTDANVLSRIALPDGRIVGPDRPITIAEQSMADAGRSAGLCWAETETTNEHGTWRYIVVINTSDDQVVRSDTFSLEEAMHVYWWRDGTATTTAELTVELAPRDWALLVCCPIPADGGEPIVGDTSFYVTMSAALP